MASADSTFLRRTGLILVMGVQRSGTTALVDSLGQDPRIRVENEDERSPFYRDHRLLPEAVIGPKIRSIRRRVLLKPISETIDRSLDDLLREFETHDPLTAWIYRDPRPVWRSWVRTFGTSPDSLESWIRDWNRRNQTVLDSLEGPFRDRVRIVAYEDLCAQPVVFERLCAWLGVRPRNNLFRRSETKPREPNRADLRIEQATRATLTALRSRRSFHDVRDVPFTHAAP